jgi:hypothetical protein
MHGIVRYLGHNIAIDLGMWKLISAAYSLVENTVDSVAEKIGRHHRSNSWQRQHDIIYLSFVHFISARWRRKREK